MSPDSQACLQPGQGGYPAPRSTQTRQGRAGRDKTSTLRAQRLGRDWEVTLVWVEFHPPELTSLGAHSSRGQPRPSWAPIPRAASLGLSHHAPRKGLWRPPPSLGPPELPAHFALSGRQGLDGTPGPVQQHQRGAESPDPRPRSPASGARMQQKLALSSVLRDASTRTHLPVCSSVSHSPPAPVPISSGLWPALGFPTRIFLLANPARYQGFGNCLALVAARKWLQPRPLSRHQWPLGISM